MEFDVFLCHNSQDKSEVIDIGFKLKERGLNPWLDEWELQPGLPWQRELERQIQNIKSAAVFVGESGIGPWQQMEIEAYLRRFVRQGCPVIPVLLSNAPNQPDLPIFLEGMTWVNFRRSRPEPMERLIWGITGIKPGSSSKEKVILPSTLEPIESDRGKNVSASASTPKTGLKAFNFEVVTVNAKGEKIKREKGEAQYYSENFGNGITLDMVAVPGGKFRMGTEDSEIERLCEKYGGDYFRREKPQHEVTIQPFFMGKYPVTQAQWQVIASRTDLRGERDLDVNPARFKDLANSDLRPVEQVSWKDVVEFCARLSKLTGKEYRLPSEAEWEYACRSVISYQLSVTSEEASQNPSYPPFYFGETITTDLVNYDGNYTYAGAPKGEYRQKTTPVGQFPPNAFGLYDMHGNVWEWCADNWHENYQGAPKDGSAWLSGGESSTKVVRGGSWYDHPNVCRSAIRGLRNPVFSNYVIGLRVVCVLPRTL